MALPPGWTRYTTDAGREYFHNGSTNDTQWESPELAGPLGPDTKSFGTSEVYVYRPEESDLELQERAADPDGGRRVAVGASASAPPPGAASPPRVALAADDGAVPLHAAPGGWVGPGGAGAGGLGSSLRSGVGGFVGGAIAAATSEDGAGMSGLLGSAMVFAQQFFDVSSDDVLKRLRLALLPYPPPPRGAPNDFRDRPDFWGPFWVATTAVLFLAATGNMARLLRLPEGSFKADYSLVGEASIMIYGLLVGVPMLTRLVMWLTGQAPDSVNFKHMICVYGYSLTPTIPVSLACLVPLEGIRWLCVLAGTGISMLFIREYLLMDISAEAPSLKWKMAALFFGSQLLIFLVYRVHFF